MCIFRIRQEKEEDCLQDSENVNKRTGRKRHYSMVECNDQIENAKRVKESEQDVHVGVETSVLPVNEGGKTGADFEINHVEPPDETVEETGAEGSSSAVSNIAMQNFVNDQGEESYDARKAVMGDVEEAHALTSFDAEEMSPVKEDRFSDAGEIGRNSVPSEYRKSQRDMRGGKPKRFVVDLDAESEDEEKYFR